MKKEYKEALTEVSEILKLMPNTLVNKIPKDFRDIIEREKAKDYFPIIEEPIENFEFRKETIALLGMIYRDFLCSPEEKQRLQMEERKELEEIMQKKLSQNYKENYSDKLREINSTKKLEDSQNEMKSENTLPALEEKWYKKIFALVKRIFK